jgi:EmrB/QacA subfamily drug resistance transporter
MMSDTAINTTSPHRAAVLAIVVTSYLMIVLDISIVITGLPKIQTALGFSPANLSWVHNAYTIAFGGLLLLGARAGDIFGRRRVFIAGLALFTLASLLVGVAQSAAFLIAARALQGVGAAILAPTTLALLSSTFAEGPERTRAIATYSAVAGAGATLGLVVGGVLADMLSWRVGFFINLPIGIVLILAVRHFVPEGGKKPGRFDIAGALSSTLGMTSLIFGIIRSASFGWHDAVTVAAIATGAALLALFVVNEWWVRQPIMPLRLFNSRERTAAYAARILFLGGMIGFFFFTTQFMQNVLGYSALHTGAAFLPMTVANVVVATAVPRLTRRLGNARLLGLGLLITVIGMAWLSRLSAGVDYTTGMALPMLLIGIGQGGALSPLTNAGIAGVAPQDAGAASGLVNVAHQLGGSLGLGVLVTIFAASGGGSTGAHDMLAHRVAASITGGTAMLALALVLVVALIIPARSARDTTPATRTTS